MKNFIITMLLCVVSFCVMGQDHRADYVFGTSIAFSSREEWDDINEKYHDLKFYSFSIDRTLVELPFGDKPNKFTPILRANHKLNFNLGINYNYIQYLERYLIPSGHMSGVPMPTGMKVSSRKSLQLIPQIRYTKAFTKSFLIASVYGFEENLFRKNTPLYLTMGSRFQLGFEKKGILIAPGIGLQRDFKRKQNFPHILLEFRFGSGWSL